MTKYSWHSAARHISVPKEAGRLERTQGGRYEITTEDINPLLLRIPFQTALVSFSSSTCPAGNRTPHNSYSFQHSHASHVIEIILRQTSFSVIRIPEKTTPAISPKEKTSPP